MREDVFLDRVNAGYFALWLHVSAPESWQGVLTKNEAIALHGENLGIERWLLEDVLDVSQPRLVALLRTGRPKLEALRRAA